MFKNKEYPTLEELKEIINKHNDSLDLSNTKINELPDNLKIGGNLIMYHTNINELHYKLKIGGWIINQR